MVYLGLPNSILHNSKHAGPDYALCAFLCIFRLLECNAIVATPVTHCGVISFPCYNHAKNTRNGVPWLFELHFTQLKPWETWLYYGLRIHKYVNICYLSGQDNANLTPLVRHSDVIKFPLYMQSHTFGPNDNTCVSLLLYLCFARIQSMVDLVVRLFDMCVSKFVTSRNNPIPVLHPSDVL